MWPLVSERDLDIWRQLFQVLSNKISCHIYSNSYILFNFYTNECFTIAELPRSMYTRKSERNRCSWRTFEIQRTNKRQRETTQERERESNRLIDRVVLYTGCIHLYIYIYGYTYIQVYPQQRVCTYICMHTICKYMCKHVYPRVKIFALRV